MILKYKKIIIICLIIAGGLIAYSLLKPDPTVTSLLEKTQRQNSTQVLGDEITLAINQINSLKLDRSVFDDPVFNKLIDQSKPIIPKPVGRDNPFSPIGSDIKTDNNSSSTPNLKIASTTVSTTTKTATTTR